MTPEELMKKAIEMSRKALADSGHRPFAAFIVMNGEIIGEGLNDTPMSHDPTAHGEVLAIRNATRRLGTADLSGCEIYTTCEPCSLCVAAIWWARIDKMYYAATLADCKEVGIGIDGLVDTVSRPVGHRMLPEVQLLSQDGRNVIKEWQESSAFGKF